MSLDIDLELKIIVNEFYRVDRVLGGGMSGNESFSRWGEIFFAIRSKKNE
jgi:hypothetical protein